MPMMDVNGGGIWVDRCGRGVPVVFSHSLFFDLSMFDAQAAALRTSHEVIRYDHRGQGRSDAAPRPALEIDSLTRDAAALIEALGVGPVHFVGNSLGGFVALRLAARRPDLLLSCTVLGSSGEIEHRRDEFAPLVAALRAEGAAAHVATLMHIMFGDTFLADPARAAERARWQAFMAALPRRIADCAACVVERDGMLPELEGCRVPVLAVAGAEDHAYGDAEAQAIARASGGRAVSVPRAGHSLCVEEPQAVLRLLADHFEMATPAVM
jgi:3-oxoadipate enol-lactonase